jgi:hypothetical protein
MSITPERWKEIEGLYHASLDQTPAERDALLANASIEVRDIVHELLSEEKTGILDGPAWKIETEALTTPSAIVPGMILGPIASKPACAPVVWARFSAPRIAPCVLLWLHAAGEFFYRRVQLFHSPRAGAVSHPHDDVGANRMLTPRRPRFHCGLLRGGTAHDAADL